MGRQPGGLPSPYPQPARVYVRRLLCALAQELYDNYFCVVDLHAITAPHTPKELTKDTYRTAALYLASGIDPERSHIFVQSHVTAHAELMWLLNCATPMGWLEKMIQYKEKSQRAANQESVSVGLFDYPVLMAGINGLGACSGLKFRLSCPRGPLRLMACTWSTSC